MWLVLNGTGTQWDWHSMGLALNGTVTQCNWYSTWLVLNVTGTQCDWYSIGLVLNGTGTQWDWYSMGLVFNVTSTQLDRYLMGLVLNGTGKFLPTKKKKEVLCQLQCCCLSGAEVTQSISHGILYKMRQIRNSNFCKKLELVRKAVTVFCH